MIQHFVQPVINRLYNRLYRVSTLHFVIEIYLINTACHSAPFLLQNAAVCRSIRIMSYASTYVYKTQDNAPHPL